MINDIIRLSKALRRDTPELLLQKDILERRKEIIEALNTVGVFRIKDVCGRTIVIRRKHD